MIRVFLSLLVAVAMTISGQAMASKLKDQSGSDEKMGSRSIFSEGKIAERTAPAARVCLEGEECGEAAAAAAAPAAVAQTPADIYQGKCFACHGTGAAGAPKVGTAGDWEQRVANGVDALYANALQGVGAMPPKGMCMDCSDDDIKAVVDYMVENSK